MRVNHSPLFTLLLILVLCTCARAPKCQAQSPDTIITVTKLPYPHLKNPEGVIIVTGGEASRPKASRSLPTPYDSCIHHRHTRLRKANLTTLQESKKGAWLKYLPTLSAGLAPNFRQTENGTFRSGLAPTLSIGLNSSLIYTAHRNKQQRAAAREAIIKRAQLQEDQELAKLHRLQRRLQIETDKLNLHDGVADIDRQLFTLYQKQYDNHDISPEEYLLKRKAFLLQELRNQDQITHIETLQREIEDLAGCLIITPLSTIIPTRK